MFYVHFVLVIYVFSENHLKGLLDLKKKPTKPEMKTFKLPPSSSERWKSLAACLQAIRTIPWLCLILCCIHLQLNQLNKFVITLHALNSCWKVLRKSVQYHIYGNCSFVTSEELLTSTGNGQSRSAEQACWRSRHRKCFKWPRQLHRNGMIIFI